MNLYDDQYNHKNYLQREKKKLEILNQKVQNICTQKHHQHMVKGEADCCALHTQSRHDTSMMSECSGSSVDVNPNAKSLMARTRNFTKALQ